MSSLKFVETHNVVVFLEKPVESDVFVEIIDFLKASSVHYALTVNPIIYTFCIEQFWATAKVQTDNRVRQLQALVDKKRVIITESSIRCDLHLEDAGGTDCLPTTTIFEELLRDMSCHKKIFVNPSHTKKVFANMKRAGKDFSRRITPLFDTMMVQASEEVGEDSDHPTDSNQIPIVDQPSTSSQPKQKQKSKRRQRKEAEVAHDETEHEESVPTPSNDPLPSGEDSMQLNDLMVLCTKLQTQVLDLEKAKDAQAKEIANLKKRVQRLERKKKSRTTGLRRLKKVGMSRRVESSEDQESLGDHEDASKQGRSIEDIDADVEVTLVNETQERQDDDLMFDTGVLDDDEVFVDVTTVEKEEQSTKTGEAVTTAGIEGSAAPTIPITVEETLAQTLMEIKAAKPKAKGIIFYDQEEQKEEGSKEKAKGSRKKMLGRKKAGKEQQQESSKKQRMEEDKETYEVEEVEEDDEAELKKHLVIKKDDDIAIDVIPLATKPPVIGIDKEDLLTLWKLVKTKHGDIRPEDEHKRVMWRDFKVMFEPDIRSKVWRDLQGYTVTIWKLYDSCGVHFASVAGEKVYAAGLQLLEDFLLNRSRIGINKWYQSFALRNFDLEDMEFESTNSGTTAKLPILKLENGDSWVLVSQTAQENGTLVTKMSITVTVEEKTNKKNDVKARSLLLMALPNEHQLTFKSLDSIFNRLQKIVSRLAILGVIIAQEDLNSKFLSSLPPEWNTHVVVWMNKPEVETISIDDLYNNFKIIEQKVKKSVGASRGAQNLAFMTAPSTNSTNNDNTASPQVSTASVSDNAVYAFMVENPNALSLLSVRAKKYYQRAGKKIFINANDIAGYDKSKVECYNCHKLGYFARECRAPKSKEGQFKNQDDTRKQGNNENKSTKAMLAIDGVGFDWSDMAEEQVQTNMALMAFSYSKVYTDKTSSKTYLKNYETLKKQCNDLIFKLNQTEFTAATYKRGLATVEEQLIIYRKNGFEKVKQEKDGIEFKIEKFDKASKDLDQLLGSQITNKSKKGLRYSAVPSPHPLIYNRPKKLDLSYSGLDEFKEPEFKGYGPENKEQVSQVRSSFVKSSTNVDKETIFPVNKKINYDYHQRKGIISRNNYNRVDAKTTHHSVHKNMSPRAVLLKIGLTPLNTVRPVNIAHPKSAVHSAKSKSHFSKQAQSIVHRPFYKQTTLTRRSVHTAKRHYYTGRPRAVNTARSYTGKISTVRVKGVNDVKTSACWVWRPTKPNGASLAFKRHNYIDARGRSNGCSRHMTGNIAYLSDFKEFDRGYVAFRGGAYGGRITGKGTLKTDSLDFEDVYFVNELKFNLFSVSQMCDKKNYVLFTDTECLVLSPNFKLPDENQILLKIPRKDNMYSFDMKNIVPKESLTCLLVKDNLVRGLPTKRFENDQTCVACLKGKQHRASCKSKVLNPITKPLFMLHMDLFGPTFVSSLMHKKYCLVVTDDYSRFTWVFFLTTKDETSEILKNFIKEIENLVDKKVKITRSDNGTEFKNKVMDDFCREKGTKREYSIARTPQQNGVAKRRNRTLIEAVKTMLADSKLPTRFWAEAVSTACYVQNRVLVVKPHNKTPYELFRGFKPTLSFMRPFGCHVTILNTLDSLGKFDGKSDKGFFVGYALSSKAFSVYNTRTRRVEENLHIGFLENKPMIEGNGPKWLFDIDSLTQSMNYILFTAGTISNDSAGTSEEISQDCLVMPIWKDTSYFDSPTKDVENDDSSIKDVNVARQHANTASPDVNTGSLKLNVVAPSVNTASSNEQDSLKDMFTMEVSHTLEATHIEFFSDEDEPEVDLGNIINSYTIPTTPNTRIHKDHPIDNVIGDLKSSVQTRRMTKPTSEQGFLNDIEPTSITKALSDSSWVEVMQEELLQFKLQQVWILVDLPIGKRAIGTKWVFRNKASAFLYGTIEEEVYVTQPPGFKDPDHLDKVYNVVKVYVDDIIFGSTNKELCIGFEKLMKEKFQMSSMGELTFFLRLQVQQKEDGIFISQDKYVAEILKKFNYTNVKSASTPVDLEKPLVKDGDADDVDVHLYRYMIGSLMYLIASRPDIMFAVCACARFQVTPKTPHLLAVKRIFRYLKGKQTLGLWYSRDSPFELVAYTDSYYAGATQDRKSTTGGSEYVAAASCCGQVGDEAVHKELGDRMERAATTTSSLEVERDLHLDDAEGTDCLPTATIFEDLARMGITPLFATMMVQVSEEVGADSGHPTDSTQVPILDQPSTPFKPKKKQTSKKTQRQEAEVPQDETEHKESSDFEKSKGCSWKGDSAFKGRGIQREIGKEEIVKTYRFDEIKAAKQRCNTAATTTTTTRPKAKGVVVQEPSGSEKKEGRGGRGREEGGKRETGKENDFRRKKCFDFIWEEVREKGKGRDKKKGGEEKRERGRKERGEWELDKKKKKRNIGKKEKKEGKEGKKDDGEKKTKKKIMERDRVYSWENTKAHDGGCMIVAERLSNLKREREELTDEEKGNLIYGILMEEKKETLFASTQEH
ncbi:putative ribonuclease H-like domain-containing protein [Tanacetum coccineum]